MKKIVLLLGLALASLLPAQGAFQSVGVKMTAEPELPAVLRMQGLREGRVKMALDVDAQGRLVDCLVISASHAELIRPCLEAVRRWEYKPARYDGDVTAARLELTINMSVTGAVVSRNVVEVADELMERIVGRRFDYEACPPDQVDRPLVAVNRVSPAYALEAIAKGVSGRVRVHFFVDEKGDVRLPAAPADTHPYLSAVAVEAMRNWKFEPPTRQGRPVLVAAVQEFDFGSAPR
ncbi:MAG TPA: TonB family protein [Lacunisphaera sp.]|nr:TonB family protein [Lacunisphaera sp.]